MAKRTSSRKPKYRRQRRKDREDLAFIELNGQRLYLGIYASPQSKQEYRRLVTEWMATDHRPAKVQADDIVIVELIAAFKKHAKKHYRNPDGSPGREQANYWSVLKLLNELYSHTLVRDFTPMALKTLRQRMIDKGWSRRSINRQTTRIRTVFRFGVSEGIVPVDVHAALCTLVGLQAGRSDAKETAPVESVPEADVNAVLPHVSLVVADMIRVQLLTGMRPAEVCVMQPKDLQTGDEVWTYSPQAHKTRHRGKRRIIHIGPKAQSIIKPYLIGRRVDEYLFSPLEAEEKRLADVRTARRTPLSCGNRPGTHCKQRPRWAPRHHYDTNSYAQAIRRGCEKAWPAPDGLSKNEAKQWHKEHRWSPNQLRHSTGTRVRKEAGLEVARAVLGHTTASVTEKYYAEFDAAKAASIMQKIG